MSEPIKLFYRDGNLVTRYSPQVARMEVEAGLLFSTRPNMFQRGEMASEPASEAHYVVVKPVDGPSPWAVDVDADMPALDGMPEPEPEPVRKVGRPRKGTGGVL